MLMLALLAVISVPLIALAMASSGVATYAPTLGEISGSSADLYAEALDKIDEPDTSSGDTLFTVTFTGMCIPGTLFGSSADGTFNRYAELGVDFFENLRGILTNDGCTVMPLGCVLATGEYDRIVKTDNPSYWVRGESWHAELLSEAGADIVPMLSGTLLDYGNSGFDATKNAVLEAGMTPITEGAYSIAVQDRLLAIRFIDASGADPASYAQSIAGDRAAADILIVAVSGFSELSDEASRELAHSLIDAGAMCVVGIDGGGLGETEKYGDGEIFYSLGTLLDGTGLSENGESLILQLTLRKSDSGELKLTSHTLMCSYDVLHWTPEIKAS